MGGSTFIITMIHDHFNITIVLLIKSWGKGHFNKDLYTNKVMGGKGILTRVYIKSLVVFYGFISVKQL
jgi:hypothetical protein